ncbi:MULTISPECIES: hypothetical protein [unclassified Bradyrhizobium]|uniref:hypothetical protein n=1 Tax=unclassified Bradyrhizobium TaxID=2631580 RepID=UPI001FF9AD76|nr:MULTISPECIES: hypothetical protein [unclassified Bradyrhizobium]MCK1707712.1 hypothetical protein [Bradyrhizobium sp. 143]MCK1730013.1 hypothetical protein [Bradyrhizobium sp. 142]
MKYHFVFGAEWTSALPAIIILVYQVMRIILTVRISPLIEAERGTGWTPARSSYQRYIWFHVGSQILGGIAITSFAWEVWQLLQQEPLMILRARPAAAG